MHIQASKFTSKVSGMARMGKDAKCPVCLAFVYVYWKACTVGPSLLCSHLQPMHNYEKLVFNTQFFFVLFLSSLALSAPDAPVVEIVDIFCKFEFFLEIIRDIS